MDTSVESAVADALLKTNASAFDATLKPAPVADASLNQAEPEVVPEVDLVTVESDSDSEQESEEDEETEEDRAFINDGKADTADYDLAAIDTSNIIQGSRRRRAPTRWEHPDTGAVLGQYYKRKGITPEDIEDLEEFDDTTSPSEELDEEEEVFDGSTESDAGDSEYDSDFKASSGEEIETEDSYLSTDEETVEEGEVEEEATVPKPDPVQVQVQIRPQVIDGFEDTIVEPANKRVKHQ